MNLSIKTLSTNHLSELLDSKVSSVKRLAGGNNSRVFKVTAEDNSLYAAKLYPGPTADGQNRMTVEFTALEFLHRKGIKSVPKPIIADENGQFALYEFVVGTKIESTQVSEADIDEATRFLQILDELKDDPDAAHLADAAESRFSIQAIISNVESRLGLLDGAEGPSPCFELLREFLDTEFLHALRQTNAWCQARHSKSGMTMEAELDPTGRTLSPSDFGFHNCLRRSDGQLVFLDFEYFGWDDPAKMISDFLLHPGMDLRDSLKRRFLENLIGTPNPDEDLLVRVETAYPLFALKWCLILLNPFLAEYRAQRGIDGQTEAEQNDLLKRQLEKAKSMLKNVETGCERFPYWDERYAYNVG